MIRLRRALCPQIHWTRVKRPNPAVGQWYTFSRLLCHWPFECAVFFRTERGFSQMQPIKIRQSKYDSMGTKIFFENNQYWVDNIKNPKISDFSIEKWSVQYSNPFSLPFIPHILNWNNLFAITWKLLIALPSMAIVRSFAKFWAVLWYFAADASAGTYTHSVHAHANALWKKLGLVAFPFGRVQ